MSDIAAVLSRVLADLAPDRSDRVATGSAKVAIHGRPLQVWCRETGQSSVDNW